MARSTRAGESNRRDDIEQMLIKRGISFTFKPGMSTDMIDQDKSLNNQARLGNPLNQKTVQQYIEALQDGDIFPPLLVHKGRGAKYLIVDGNHRLAAHIATGLNPDVYILEAKNSQVITLLSMTANTKHGLPNSPEERLQHALFMCDNGMSIPEAARSMNVPRVELSRAVKKREAERRAAENGILATEWETLPSSSRTRLLQIYTDEGFVEAYQLVRDAALDATEVNALVSRMNETKSGTRQKGVVRAVRLELDERIQNVAVQGKGKTGRQPSSPRQRLAISLGAVNGLPDPTVFLQLDMPEDLRADFCKRTDEAITQLQQIREALAGAE